MNHNSYTFIKPSVKKLMLGCLLAATVAGCQTNQVSRVDPNEEIALTDKWNAKDSQLVAEKMIDDMLTFPWLDDFSRSHGKRRPAVIVQYIRNESHEHISSEAFINDLKRAMLRTGKVDFVAGKGVRDDVRTERADQEAYASMKTQAQMGEETGADFALSGTINSFVDSAGGKRVTSYQVDLRLIDMTTNRETWNGQEKIQKFQEKSSFKLW